MVMVNATARNLLMVMMGKCGESPYGAWFAMLVLGVQMPSSGQSGGCGESRSENVWIKGLLRPGMMRPLVWTVRASSHVCPYSDHLPLMLTPKSLIRQHARKRFCFDNMWLRRINAEKLSRKAGIDLGG
nr:uncharacterized protein LOC109158082 [Ipomoea batatas]